MRSKLILTILRNKSRSNFSYLIEGLYFIFYLERSGIWMIASFSIFNNRLFTFIELIDIQNLNIDTLSLLQIVFIELFVLYIISSSADEFWSVNHTAISSGFIWHLPNFCIELAFGHLLLQQGIEIKLWLFQFWHFSVTSWFHESFHLALSSFKLNHKEAPFLCRNDKLLAVVFFAQIYLDKDMPVSMHCHFDKIEYFVVYFIPVNVFQLWRGIIVYLPTCYSLLVLSFHSFHWTVVVIWIS